MQAANWISIFLANGTNEKVDLLTDILFTNIFKHVPLQNRTLKNLPALWLTVDIKKAMQMRDKARRIWFKSKDAAFKKLRNHMQDLIRTAKKQHYQNFFKCNDNSRMF